MSRTASAETVVARARHEPHRAPASAVAIVGIACRFPGAADPLALWRRLRAGESAVTRASERRRSAAAGSAEAGAVGGFIDGVDEFDAEFFGISPKEAAAMDPQQRLALELSWEALEDAGAADRARSLSGGVFMGLMADDYGELVAAGGTGAVGRHTLTGVARSLTANRISRFLALDGPSLTVDTGQSSSLVAVHLARESICRGEVDLALAGGVHLILGALGTARVASFGALSPDGRCFVFDARANGYVRGEGGGIVVLKRIEHAIADGDRIYAVLRGSAVNHGTDERAVTVPSGHAQQRVMRAALEVAAMSPQDVQYVELHGTGTPVGDPVEAAAVGEVYGRDRSSSQPLLVGSVKSNIGHLEGAAGIAGLIKAALCVTHREVVPSLNFCVANPAIAMRELGLRVATRSQAWPAGGPVAGAAVSAFGMGGTNCHAVLSQAPPVAQRPTAHELPVVPWVLSATSAESLVGAAARLAERVRADDALAPGDVAWSLATGRARFDHRAVLLGSGREDLLAGLDELVAGAPGPCVRRAVARRGKVALSFAGQGTQRAGMGRGLYDAFPLYARTFDGVCEAFDCHLERPLKEVVFAAQGSAEAALLDRTQYTQCALFAVEVALFALLASWGIEADYVIGHSIGELVGAHVAGVLSVQDACTLVAARGRLMGALAAGGGMVALLASERQVRERLEGVVGIQIAAVNGPRAVVVSGEQHALDAWVVRWPELHARQLRVSHAFHSHLMEPMLDAFTEIAAGLCFQAPAIPIVSNVTGQVLSAQEACSAEYWGRHVREPVRFMDGVHWLRAAGTTRFLELGPGSALSAMTHACLSAEAQGDDLMVVSALRFPRPEPEALMSSVATAFGAGVHVDWGALLGGAGRRVTLPGYAFARKRYWLETATAPVPAPVSVSVPVASTADVPVDGRLAALSGDELDAAVLELVRDELALVLGHGSADAVDPQRALHELGLDSLGAVELRDRLQLATGLALPATLVFDHPTALGVVAFIRARLGAGVPRDATADERLRCLETLLVSLSADREEPSVGPRMRELLARFGAYDGPHPDHRVEEIADASAEELFALIDTRFTRS